mgnify:FL=1
MKLLLIDGHSILHRAYYGVPKLTRADGVCTNAVYGFLNILFMVMESEKPDRLAVAFDLSEPTFRHKMFPEYKGTRKPMEDDLRPQVPMIKDLLRLMNVTVVELSGYEADDILGTLSVKGEEKDYDVTILSGDRDLLQLATKKVCVMMPKIIKGKTEYKTYYENNVIDEYKVTPTEFIDLKAIMGDTSDNIPGVKGIGEKGASDIIVNFHSIENAFENRDKITNKRNAGLLEKDFENCKLSKVLATINVNAPVDVLIDDCKIDNMFNEKALEGFKKLNLKSLLKYFDETVLDSGDAKTSDITENIKSADSEDLTALVEAFADGDTLGLSFSRYKKETKAVQLDLRSMLNANTSQSEVKQEDLANNYGIVISLYYKDTSYVTNFENAYDKDLENLVSKMLSKKVNVYTFDIKHVLRTFNVDIKNIFATLEDASIAAYLLNPLLGSYSPDYISEQYLGSFFKTDSVYLTDTTKPLDEIVKKTASQSFIAFNALPKLLSELKNESMYDLYKNIEIPCALVLSDMEKEGILVNRTAMKNYSLLLEEKIKILEKEIYEEIGEEFNINSPKQLGEILFVKKGLKGGKKTKTGYSTSADVLNKLALEYGYVKKILDYRGLTKLKSTYADGLDAYILADGRIHTNFKQTVTATGRLSSAEPNLQNIPVRMAIGKKMREVFVASEGCTFIDADYSQIELRILAHMSGDKALIEAYNSGDDIHAITASKVFNVPLEEVSAEQRRNAKAVNFGIVYGISSYGLSEDLSISKSLAEEYIEQYFVNYPGIKKYLDDTVEAAKKNGYTKTLYNRKRPIPELSSDKFMIKKFGERVAMNSPIQGTAADIMKIAMINVYYGLKEAGLKAKILLQVHDELLIEAPLEEASRVKEIVVDKMQHAADLFVKLSVSAGEGKDWLAAH